MFVEDMSVFYDLGGFAQAATYTPRSGPAVPCVVLVEHDLSRYGETAQVNVKTAVISMQVSEIAQAPRSGDTFAITGGPTYKVDSLQATDPLEHRVFVA